MSSARTIGETILEAIQDAVNEVDLDEKVDERIDERLSDVEVDARNVSDLEDAIDERFDERFDDSFDVRFKETLTARLDDAEFVEGLAGKVLATPTGQRLIEQEVRKALLRILTAATTVEVPPMAQVFDTEAAARARETAEQPSTTEGPTQ